MLFLCVKIKYVTLQGPPYVPPEAIQAILGKIPKPLGQNKKTAFAAFCLSKYKSVRKSSITSEK